jgi:large subunit ribosomal protein L10e
MRGKCYRFSKGMAYTRKKYIHGSPQNKISKFTMGNPNGNYGYRASLIVQDGGQIRHNALEAARIAGNKVLFDKLGENGYVFHINVYPHMVLRENKMMAFAGADRLQEGMRKAFGKPIGSAARVKRGQVVITEEVPSTALELAKESMRLASSKIPLLSRVEITAIEEAVPQ